MAFTLTILDDANHTCTVSKQTLGRAGEAGEIITVVTPSSLYNLGYDAYLHFLLPDGTPVYKGSYPCTSASFTVTIGATDNILALEGTIIMQFVLINGTAYIWKSEEKRLDVVSAVNATAPATAVDYLYVQIPTTYVSGNLMGYDSTTHKAVDLGYAVDPALVGVATPTSFTDGNIATYNSTTKRLVDAGALTAATIPIVDAGNIITATNAETALQENRTAIDVSEADIVVLKAERDGWIAAGETWTYASASTFTVAADVSAKYGKGDKIKLTQTTAKYFYVISAVYSAPNTTVTVTAGTSYTIANAAITLPYYSHEENPFGFPTWFTWTPTYTGFSANPTTVCIFKIVNDQCFINMKASATGTSNATTFTMTLPVPATATVSRAFTAVGIAFDNGAVTYGIATIYGYLAATMAIGNGLTGTWTNSGVKYLDNLQMFYEIA